MVAACAAGPRPRVNDATPSRDVVHARLDRKVAADPNRELCERITTGLAAGDRDALRPLFDHASYAERVLAKGSVDAETARDLRARSDAFKEFARIHTPRESKFRCLGTRSLFGEPVLAIRQWTPTRFDYILVHLTGKPDRPADDYMIASGGSYHSEADRLQFSKELGEGMKVVGEMLQLSYDRKFGEIIAAYQKLPGTLRASPVAFFHYINAVFTIEKTGSPLYREAVAKMELILGDRPYSLAYWRLFDAQRQSDEPARQASQSRLLELLDDYELLGER